MGGAGHRPAGRTPDRVAGRAPDVHGAAVCRRATSLPSLQEGASPLPSSRAWPRGSRGTTAPPTLVERRESAVCAARHRHSACATPCSARTSPPAMADACPQSPRACPHPLLACLRYACQRPRSWRRHSARRLVGLGMRRFERHSGACLRPMSARPSCMLGRLALRQECLRLLSNRLHMQEDLQRCPRIAHTPIKKPLVIVGLPRTGTTVLHHLLAQDPSARVPRLWELLQPSPPPCPGTVATEPRRKRGGADDSQSLCPRPAFPGAPSLSATGPEECVFLFQQTFMSVVFEAYGEVPDYINWLLHQDLTPAYRYYRQQLQVLQWRWPGDHWVLKSPHHLFFLDVLLTVFPDACVVQTHRDPATALASLCSLMATTRSLYSQCVAAQRLAPNACHLGDGPGPDAPRARGGGSGPIL